MTRANRGKKPGRAPHAGLQTERGLTEPRTLHLMSEPAARRALDAALVRRAGLLTQADTDVCRILHDSADGIAGLVLERFGETLIAQLHEGRLAVTEDLAAALCETAMKRFGCTAVYRKLFPRDRSASFARLEAAHTAAAPWLGRAAPPEQEVRESGLRFLIRAYDGYSTGLFLEQRENRRRVRELARDRRVLNLFAYTCAFSVAGAAGGATATVSVDVSKKYLEWGKRNFAANELGLDAHTFIASDVLEFFPRALRQQRRFDLIVIDPPTFGRAKGATRPFELKRDLPRVLEQSLGLLDSGGVLLLSLNHRATSFAKMEQLVRGAAGRRVAEVERLSVPEDFAGDPDYSKSLLATID